MSRYERRILMDRLKILFNGICGFCAGGCFGLMILIFCILMDVQPQTLFGLYFMFCGPTVILGCLGFYISVKDNWWRMKRRW